MQCKVRAFLGVVVVPGPGLLSEFVVKFYVHQVLFRDVSHTWAQILSKSLAKCYVNHALSSGVFRACAQNLSNSLGKCYVN